MAFLKIFEEGHLYVLDEGDLGDEGEGNFAIQKVLRKVLFTFEENDSGKALKIPGI